MYRDAGFELRRPRCSIGEKRCTLALRVTAPLEACVRSAPWPGHLYGGSCRRPCAAKLIDSASIGFRDLLMGPGAGSRTGRFDEEAGGRWSHGEA
jgi:hypothetical protein